MALKSYNKTNTFGYKKEFGQNPNTGFMSFQHFNGGKLYSDSIVKPENRLLETEPLECYPIAHDAEERGREQGYYPESSVAYFRILWKDWEPERGKYNIQFVKDIIDKAKENNQTLFFRLMAHSTRECEDVPEWLKGMIDCPERPDGMRVKDSPSDPLFIKLFGEAIMALGENFDKNSGLYMIDISLPGAWGEGHNLEVYKKEDLEWLFDVYMQYFPNTRLMAQLWRPDYVNYITKTRKAGIRGDGYGEPHHVHEKYPPAMEVLKDTWKISPVSLETYWWIGEWMRKGWDIDELIDISLKWHVSSINAKSMPVPWEWKEKIDYWIEKMGYHFVINSFSYPDKAAAGDELAFRLSVDNVGVAPLYDDAKLYIKLTGDNEYTFETDNDLTKWLPGKRDEEIAVKLPSDIKNGKYNICLNISKEDFPPFYFATDAKKVGNDFIVGEIEIR